MRESSGPTQQTAAKANESIDGKEDPAHLFKRRGRKAVANGEKNSRRIAKKRTAPVNLAEWGNKNAEEGIVLGLYLARSRKEYN